MKYVSAYLTGIQHNGIYDRAVRCNYISSEVRLQDRRTLLNLIVFLLYYISCKSGFDDLFSKNWQTNPAISVHDKTILIPMSMFLTNNFCLCDLST